MAKFARQKLSPLFLVSILMLNLCFLSFGQNNSKPQKISFGSISVVNESTKSTELTRPRIITQKVTDQTDETRKTKSNVIVVTSASTITGLERKAFDILNEKRKENNLPQIDWSDEMAKIARFHSENMAKFKFFSHAGKDGLMVNDRADALGFSSWRAIGENIAYNKGYENPVEFAYERWMLSNSHRENILNPRWKEAGIGVAITSDGTYYFTQVFVVR